jgi:uncharacterized protein YkwD
MVELEAPGLASAPPPADRTGMGRSVHRRRALVALWAATLAIAGITVAPAAGSALPTCPDANAIPTRATVDKAQGAVLCLVNRERQRRGKRPLRDAAALRSAAAGHSRDMVARHYFDHDTPGGRDLVDRVMAAHWASRHSAWRLGENIAWGGGAYATPRRIVALWMGSPGHRANILDGRFREAGAGVAAGTPQRTRRRGATYTMDFGTRG